MSTALYAFDEPSPARRAAELLQQQGLPAASLHLHLPAASPADRSAVAIDEQATGGLLTNVAGLFGEMFEWGSLPIDTSSYAATVRRGGAVLGVDADSATQRSTVEAAIEPLQPALRSPWFEIV